MNFYQVSLPPDLSRECHDPTKGKDSTWEDAFDESGNAVGESKVVAARGKPNYNYYSMDSRDLTSTHECKPDKPSAASTYVL